MSFRHHIALVEQATAIEEIHLDRLPYSLDALEPAMSEKSVDVHYNTLTKNYFKKYEATGDLFQKAGALLHNNFFWPLLQPYNKRNKPSKELLAKIQNTHGNFESFKNAVIEKALSIQGNGWVLILTDLQIVTIQNHILRPEIAMAIDLWEHTTVDYDFNREKFFSEFWNVVNWSELEERVL